MIRVHRRRLAFFMPLRATDRPITTFCTHGFRPEFCPYCTNKGRRL